MERNRRVILFAHPRSGSSSLYQILQMHPSLHILEEPFNEEFTRWHPQNPNYLERVSLPITPARLQWRLSQSDTLGAPALPQRPLKQ